MLTALTTLVPDENMSENRAGWMRKPQLADPKYNVEVFEEIIEPPIIKRVPLMCQRTKLGWLPTGKTSIGSSKVTMLISDMFTTGLCIAL